MAKKMKGFRGAAGIKGPLDAAGTHHFAPKALSIRASGMKGGGKRRMGALGLHSRRRSQTRAGFAHR
jgi:hypothetical protein